MALDNHGDTAQVQGSGAKPYTLKNINGVLSCDCVAWKMQKVKIDQRTCKHLRQVRGTQVENARVALATGQAVAAAPAAPVLSPSPAVAPAVLVPGQTPAEARIAQIRALLGANRYFEPIVEPDRSQIVAMEETRLGRKLRQDEKTGLFGPPVLLAHAWDGVEDPTGYLISTKYDGIRAVFTGTHLVSRQGNVFPAPAWFLAGLGKIPLDSEIYLSRGLFQETTSAIHGGEEGWKKVSFLVIDAPAMQGTFEQRVAALQMMKGSFAPFVKLIEHTVCKGIDHLKHLLEAEEVLGGEGLMLRKSGSAYTAGHGQNLLKVKSFFDSEAVVTGYVAGKGSNKGVIGSLQCVAAEDMTLKIGGKTCVLRKGTTFDVGSGLTAETRRTPPAIGKTITFRFLELTKDGVPRNGSFVTVRDYE